MSPTSFSLLFSLKIVLYHYFDELPPVRCAAHAERRPRCLSLPTSSTSLVTIADLTSTTGCRSSLSSSTFEASCITSRVLLERPNDQPDHLGMHLIPSSNATYVGRLPTQRLGWSSLSHCIPGLHPRLAFESETLLWTSSASLYGASHLRFVSSTQGLQALGIPLVCPLDYRLLAALISHGQK